MICIIYDWYNLQARHVNNWCCWFIPSDHLNFNFIQWTRTNQPINSSYWVSPFIFFATHISTRSLVFASSHAYLLCVLSTLIKPRKWCSKVYFLDFNNCILCHEVKSPKNIEVCMLENRRHRECASNIMHHSVVYDYAKKYWSTQASK
jgi:hypothetical protein